MTMKQYGKMTKAALVRKIMKALKKMPKTKLVKLCYELEKKKLPKLPSYSRKSLQNWQKVVDRPLTKKQRTYIRKRKPRRRTTRKRVTIGQRRFVKGSPEAKRYMAKLRRMRR